MDGMSFWDEQVMFYGVLLRDLRVYAKKPNGSLKAEDLRSTDRCAVGRWLDAERRDYAATAEFSKLEADHAHFHAAAADLILRMDESPATAPAAVDTIPFKKSFGSLVRALVAMKAKFSA